MNEVEANTQQIEPNTQIVERFNAAYYAYLQALQIAWSAPEIQQDGTAAYQNYMQVLQEMMELDIRQRMLEAWKTYVGFVEKTLLAEGVREQAREAYQNYLKSIQKAWSESNPEELNAVTLSAIGQNLSAASWLAAASTGEASRLTEMTAQNGPVP
jgi:hypothetical protein